LRINKISILILITIILLSPIIVIGATTPVINPSPSASGTNPVDITGIFMQEEIKTRADFKAYTDKKIDDMVNLVENDGYKFMDDLFQKFDKKMRDLAQAWVIRITITVFTSTLLAHLVYYFIRRKIEKHQRPRIDTIRHEGIAPARAGIIDEGYMKTISETQKLPTNPETHPVIDQYPIYPAIPPKPPSQREVMKNIKKKEKETKQLLKAKTAHEEYLAKQKKIYEKKLAEETKTAQEIALYEQSKRNIIKKIEANMGKAHEINHPINPPNPASEPPKPPEYALKEPEIRSQKKE
jgi:hypothetical protein